MAVNKVTYGDNTLMDLTNDSVTPEVLLSGYTAHDKSGEPINGSYIPVGGHTIYDSDDNEMPMEEGLKFDGLNVEDDSENNRTTVHGNLKVCLTETEWNAMPDEEKNDPNIAWFLPWMDTEFFATDRTSIGTVIGSLGDSAPSDDYLLCSGQIRNITDYPKLASWIEDQYGSINYFGGDGVTTFAVPNFRADFPTNGVLSVKAKLSSTVITTAEIDDELTSSTTLWSSEKVKSEIDSLMTIGTWIPHLYDYNTYIQDLPVCRYFKLGSIYIMEFAYTVTTTVTISTMLQIRNLPCKSVIGGNMYSQGASGQFGDKTLQAVLGTGYVYLRPNFKGTLTAGSDYLTGMFIGYS